jgi:REP element-mobilizing transposase RayT
MARLRRICPPGIPRHIIQRGNNRRICFAVDEDFAAYAHWLRESSQKYGVAIHAWISMTNYVHIFATPQQPDGLSCRMQRVGRFKSCVVAALFQTYIEDATLNAIRTSTRKGLALGNEPFKVQALTGRRVTAQQRGPKKAGWNERLDRGAQEFLL